MDETFDERPRRLEQYTVESFDVREGRASVSTTTSTGFATDAKYADELQPGTVFELETVNGSLIIGIRVAGVWLFRKSDQQLQREHEEMVAGLRRREREQLEAHREEWQAREDALPEWVRGRLQSFHASGGEQFELQGWAYELIICELAVAYLASGGVDDAAVNAIAYDQGTSGNQHDMAKLLARTHHDDPAFPLAGTVSALSPITGDADYSKAGA